MAVEDENHKVTREMMAEEEDSSVWRLPPVVIVILVGFLIFVAFIAYQISQLPVGK